MNLCHVFMYRLKNLPPYPDAEADAAFDHWLQWEWQPMVENFLQLLSAEGFC